MHLATTISLIATIATMASAIKVQYYSDGGCSNYLVEFYPPGNGNCYNYEYSNSHSANVATCDGPKGCGCVFYDGRGCKGKAWSSDYTGKNCASNWDGGGFKSMKCYSY
jgi:hypothetical protein